jgi:wyosine [tRNA(Phe)-imidazoG37] synthetase (radical SAM superfamily)
MTVLVVEAHAHIQRLVSVVKMATVLEVCTTEEQRSVVRFLLVKGVNAEDIHKNKCFLFTVGRVRCVKCFTTGW